MALGPARALGARPLELLSVGVSATLVVLYWLTYRTQKRRTDAQVGTTESTGDPGEPVLFAADVGADGDALVLELGNEGDGDAVDLSVRCFLLVEADDGYRPAWESVEPASSPVPVPLARADAEDRRTEIGRVNRLGAGETGTAFEAAVELAVDGRRVAFSEAVERLGRATGSSTVGVALWLEYADADGDRRHERIVGYADVPTEPTPSLETALRMGEQRDPVGGDPYRSRC